MSGVVIVNKSAKAYGKHRIKPNNRKSRTPSMDYYDDVHKTD